MKQSLFGDLSSRHSFLVWTIFWIAAIVPILWMVETAENNRHRQSQRVATLEKLSTIRAKLEGELNGELLLSRSLITMITIKADIDEETFTKTVSHFIDKSKHIRNIGLARGTVLAFVYPLEGNRAAIGLDYTKAPDQWVAVKKAIESRKTVVAGPVNLVQGGVGIIGRTPIYLDKQVGGETESGYFGLLSVVIDIPSLFTSAGLMDEKLPLSVAIRGKDGLGAQGDVFHGPKELFTDDSVSMEVHFFDNSWIIAAAPRAGWDDMSPQIIYFRIAFAVAGLVVLVLLGLKNRETTMRRYSEEKMAESEERFRTLFNKSAEAILIINEEKFIDCNEAAVTMLGCSDKSEMLETHPSELSPEFQPDDRRSLEKAQEMMEIALQRGSHRFEWTHLRTDGESFPVEVMLTAIPVGDTQLLHTVWRDLSAHKKAEADRREMEVQLRQANKMEAMGTLAGGIAHDFNNILGAVLGYTELVLLNNKLDPDDRQSLEAVLSAAERARDLVKQILMFSRKDEESRQPLQIHLVIAEAVKMLRQTIPTTINIKLDIDSHTGYVVGDGTKIHQIAMNLCTNAYYAMKETGGDLTVTLKPVGINQITASKYPDLHGGAYALLTVEDTGEGIDATDLPRIFDPFFTTKEVGEGTGMGLSVVHGIVKNHGGTIGVESELGSGTKFEVFLPLTVENSSSPTNSAETIKTGSEHILFVDDEPLLRELGGKALESLGYRVTVTASPQEALAALKANPGEYDLLLTDQTMPGMTGDMLAREALRLHPGFPVIICTGYSEILDKQNAQAMGVRALLLKPLTRAMLSKTIRGVLSESA